MRPYKVTEDCADTAETAARAARAHVSIIEKIVKNSELTVVLNSVNDEIRLYRHGCTNKNKNK